MWPSSTAVQRGLCGVDLRQNVLAGHVLVHHAVDGLYLPDDLFQPPVQIFRIHTLLHVIMPSYRKGYL